MAREDVEEHRSTILNLESEIEAKNAQIVAKEARIQALEASLSNMHTTHKTLQEDFEEVLRQMSEKETPLYTTGKEPGWPDLVLNVLNLGII